MRKDLLQRVTQRGTVGGRRASRVDMLASDTGSWFYQLQYFGDLDIGAVETWGKYEDAVRKGSLSGFIRRAWAFGSSGYRARPDHENQLKSQINSVSKRTKEAEKIASAPGETFGERKKPRV